jgi:5,10-methenyltetrahydromethanopterin hydrogenase
MNAKRTFTVMELGQRAAATDIRVPASDVVEVVDLTTRAVTEIKAAAVSMYRHTLRWQGKSYNILNIREYGI